MVTSYYIMKLNKKIISMEEYYSGLHNTPAMFSTHLEQKCRCRVCLQESDLISITRDISYSELKEALNIFGNINIDDGKENLTYLCNICHKFLKSATLFRKIAILTNQKLQQSADHLDDNLATFEDSKSDPIKSSEDLKCLKDAEVDCTQNQCPLCGKLLNKSTYWVHLKKHNVVPVDELSLKDKLEDKLILRPICEEEEGDASSNKIQLDKFNEENYEEEWLDKQVDVEDDGPRVQCPICEEFLSMSLYEVHILKEHNLNEKSEHQKDENTKIKCTICGKLLYESLYNIHMERHNVLHKDDEVLVNKPIDNSHKCNVCEKLVSKSSLKEHFNKHIQDEWFEKKHEDDGFKVQCPVCKQLLEKKFYKSHVKNHLLEPEPDDGTKIVCPICGEFFSKSSHWNHVKKHYSNLRKEKTVKESEEKIIAQKSDIPFHKTSSKVCLQDQNPQILKEIEVSQEINTMPQHLRDHQYLVIHREDTAEDNTIEEHTDIAQETDPLNEETFNKDQVDDGTKVQCPMCQKFLNKPCYVAHLMEEHDIMSLNDESLECELKDKVQLQCLICGKHLSLALYANHMQQHKSPEEHCPVCPICKKIYKTIDSLKKHMELHDPSAPIKCVCEICGKSFKRKITYDNHVARHETRYIYKCEICPFAARCKASLMHHMRIHSGELRYLCTHCPARYVYCSSLRSHIRTQHTEPQYKCDSCGKAYFTKLELVRHIDTAHLGIRNHACNVCGATFGYRRRLLRHQRRMHKKGNINPFLNRSTTLSITKKLLLQQ